MSIETKREEEAKNKPSEVESHQRLRELRGRYQIEPEGLSRIRNRRREEALSDRREREDRGTTTTTKRDETHHGAACCDSLEGKPHDSRKRREDKVASSGSDETLIRGERWQERSKTVSCENCESERTKTSRVETNQRSEIQRRDPD